jgi:hypothetical protein
MNVRIKLYTHEVIIHSQINAIEKALNRQIEANITLNQKEQKSNIEFEVSEKELTTIKHDLGFNVMVYDGDRWLPHL